MIEIAETMAAVVLTGHGGLDKLEYRTDVPVPSPGPGEVLVAVRACGLNNTDINTRTAWYSGGVAEGTTPEGSSAGYRTADVGEGTWGGGELVFPRIQGADVAGRAVAVGPGVGEALIGSRVMVDPWLLDGHDPSDLTGARYLGSEVDGGFAEYAIAPAGNVHEVRSPLSDAELATFACAYTTAENLLDRAQVADGDVVVVTGASGGVGSAAIQLCGIRGAIVVAVATGSKAAPLLDLGAAAVVDRHTSDLGAAVLEATPTGSIDVVADVVGAPMFAELVPLLRPGGRYTTSGCIAGPLVELDLRNLVYRDLKFTGATVCPPGTFHRVLEHIEAGRLRPQLAATYPLERLREAQAAFVRKDHVGNIVVEMPSAAG